MKKYDVDYVKIDNKSMLRDMKSKALINTDIDQLKANRDKKQTMKTMHEAIEEINNTKKEVAEIKDMLKMILDRI